MQLFEEYLLSKRKENSFKKSYKIDFQVSWSKHAEERQHRHGDGENYISDAEIIEVVKKASNDIVHDLIENSLDVGDRLVVHCNKDELNVVCQLHKGNLKYDLIIDIVTVIRAKDFWNTKDNKIYEVN